MDKQQLRQRVWDELTRTGQAGFPRPVHGRIPAFVGAPAAAARIRELPEYQKAKVVKVGPDSPLHPIRIQVLLDGKTLYMPTPRLTAGFVVLKNLPPQSARKATALANFKEYGREVALSEIDPIDLVVAGTVAVSPRSGVRIGKGEGYGDMEFALLCELNKLQPDTPVITSVHELQVIDQELPWDPHDIGVDYILTPERVITTERSHPQPSQIDWSLLSEERIQELQPLLELRRMQSKA